MLAETSTIEDCLESDVHHMMSQILLILNDFIQDCTFFTIFWQFFKSLDLNNSRTSFYLTCTLIFNSLHMKFEVMWNNEHRVMIPSWRNFLLCYNRLVDILLPPSWLPQYNCLVIF